MKKIAFVLGNGESRQNIDPAALTQHGAVYGCNALYRTFSPDVLVATDHGIAREIQAAGIACDDGYSCVYLLGFDLGPSPAGRFNNVYAGTPHYKPLGADPTFTGNWQRQLVGIMDKFYQVRFIRVMGAETAVIPEFVMKKNYQAMPLADFVQRLNNAKGF